MYGFKLFSNSGETTVLVCDYAFGPGFQRRRGHPEPISRFRGTMITQPSKVSFSNTTPFYEFIQLSAGLPPGHLLFTGGSPRAEAV